MNAVEIRDLFRVYPTPEGGVAALQGLSLTVREGEVCVVLGPSGSGKTTLLRVVAGFERPSAGSVQVAGIDLGRLSTAGLARHRSRSLGYADQHYWRALASELTAVELVGVQLGLAGAGPAARRSRAVRLLERVGLGERRDAHPSELSGGEQQRLAVCAAVAHRPRLLIADEPTGELDTASAEDVFDLVRELSSEEGCTVLLVSHDPASAAIADRVVHVRDGRVSEEVAAGDGAESIVVGRGGWLRLPEELLRTAGVRGRASARLREREIVVTAVDRGAAPMSPDSAKPAPPPAGDGPVVLEAQGLTRTYGRMTALAPIDAAFRARRLTAVIGPSGSGKTTLLHLLAGLDLPTAGEVVLDGIPVTTLDRAARAELRRRRIAFVGQTPGLVAFLGARENVELALTLRGIGHDEARRRALAALTAVGLQDHADQRIEELSAGQRVRAAVARALAARPQVLLADEPTARLDGANALALGALLAELAATTGAAVVCATHDPLLIEQASDQLSLDRRPDSLPHVVVR